MEEIEFEGWRTNLLPHPLESLQLLFHPLKSSPFSPFCSDQRRQFVSSVWEMSLSRYLKRPNIEHFPLLHYSIVSLLSLVSCLILLTHTKIPWHLYKWPHFWREGKVSICPYHFPVRVEMLCTSDRPGRCYQLREGFKKRNVKFKTFPNSFFLRSQHWNPSVVL